MNINWTVLLYGAGGFVLFAIMLLAAKIFKARYEEYSYNTDKEVTHLQGECIKYQDEDKIHRSLIELIHSSANQYQNASITHYVMGFSITILLLIVIMYTHLKGQGASYLFAAVLPVSYIFTMAFHWSVKSDCFHKVLHKEASRLRHQHKASMQGK